MSSDDLTRNGVHRATQGSTRSSAVRASVTTAWRRARTVDPIRRTPNRAMVSRNTVSRSSQPTLLAACRITWASSVGGTWSRVRGPSCRATTCGWLHRHDGHQRVHDLAAPGRDEGRRGAEVGQGDVHPSPQPAPHPQGPVACSHVPPCSPGETDGDLPRVEERVTRAAEATLAEQGYVSAIDVLLRLGWLAPSQLDLWRQGRVECLERMVQAGLGKQSTAMRTLRTWATRRGLTPSETAYVARTRDRRRLRFSVSGDPDIERAYRTHWVSPDLSARKAERLRPPRTEPPDLVVVVSAERVDMRGLRHDRRRPAAHAGRRAALPALRPARPPGLPPGRRRDDAPGGHIGRAR